MVSGEPAPKVTWSRNKGEINDPEKYKTRYDERTQEYILEVRGEKRHGYFINGKVIMCIILFGFLDNQHNT